ncbi:MAG: BatA domain-containing protein [Phycisphaerales bacterium]|nr:BatA domain-containing protein [Phycisphaerales bacterium]
MTFLSAGLLFGLGLAAVPIIIHILNRRRFQVVEWPPMKYLKLTLRKNRKRIRIEQMILLAMRVLAVVLLILAVARPVVSQGWGGGLAALLPGKARTSRVIVIDDSLSMGYTVAGRTAFAVGQQAAKDLIKGAGGVGKQDSLTLMVTSLPRTPLVRDASLQEAGKFAELVSGLTVTETASNWAAVFEGIEAALTAASFSNREVVLITDMRRAGWTTEVTAAANRLAAKWGGVPLRIVDVGDRRTENVAVLKFEMQDAIALPGQPVHLVAVVRNQTGAAMTGVQATLMVDGEGRSVMLPALAVEGAGGTGGGVEVPLTVSFEEVGTHVLSLTVGKDAMPGDDTWYLVVNVRPTVTVMLVDGEPSAQAFESETDFLALAYSIGAKPWNVQRVTEIDARRLKMEPPDVLVLANVAALTNEQVETIEGLVQNGMGLMIFTGELVDGEFYNQKLFKEGKGLLPVRLDRAVETPVAGIVVEKDPQSPLATLGKLLPEALARVRTRKFTAVQMGARSQKPEAGSSGASLNIDGTPPDGRVSDSCGAEGVSVLARWNNSEMPVAVVEKGFGKGRVVLFTTTAGRKWTDWPLDPTYVLGVRSAALAVAQSQNGGEALTAGDVIRVTLADGVAILPEVVGPNQKTAEAMEVDRTEGKGTVLRYGKTQRAGIYTASWKDDKSRPMSRTFAVNPAASESELEPIAESELEGLLGNWKANVQRYDANGVGLGSPPREMWRQMAMILLGLMLAEAMFAVWVGRER